jgi:hypothetical protein
MAEPTAPVARAGDTPAPAQATRLESLEFKSDHGLLKDCKGEHGWKNAGEPCPAPHWTPESTRPISMTMDTTVRARLDLEPKAAEPAVVSARAAAATIHGRGPGGLVLESRGVTLAAGPTSVEVASTQPIERRVQKLGLDIEWSAGGAAGPLSPDRTSNVAYVTMGTPKDDKQNAWQEDGVTLKRMDRAVSWVGAVGSLDPHQIVLTFLEKFPTYTLKPSPKVPRQYRHPTYFNNEGGAWAMSDHVEETGECQAIVRLIRAMLRQVGVPGEANVLVVWSDPGVGKGRTALSADLEENPRAGLDATGVVNGRRCFAALVDAPVRVGKTYPASHTRDSSGAISPGLNRYEACLEFTHGGKTLYYAGGAGVYRDKKSILETFWGLIWVSAAPNDGYRVEKIVARYGTRGGTP